MKTLNKGFTLIELIMVIVIIGILSAVAIPAYVDLETEAGNAAAAGVAGALASASAINRAACVAGSDSCVVIANCDDLGALLQGGEMPTNFAITPAVALPPGGTATCTVTRTGGGSATFTGIGS